MEEEVIRIAKRIQAISQTGIRFTKDTFDKQRFEELRELSVQLMGQVTDAKLDRIRDLFTHEDGFQTPKVDIRAVVLHDDKILLTRENSDNKWSLPGGYADVNFSPREIAEKEVYEETGLCVKANRVLALIDTNKHNFPPLEYHFYKVVILCDWINGSLRGSDETIESKFFAFDQLPVLSEKRNNNELLQLIQSRIKTNETYTD